MHILRRHQATWEANRKTPSRRPLRKAIGVSIRLRAQQTSAFRASHIERPGNGAFWIILLSNGSVLGNDFLVVKPARNEIFAREEINWSLNFIRCHHRRGSVQTWKKLCRQLLIQSRVFSDYRQRTLRIV